MTKIEHQILLQGEGENMNKPPILCDRCQEKFHCDLNYDGNACRKCRDVEPTNADKIRAKTDEELAEWLDRIRMLCANDGCGKACPLVKVCYSKAETPTETLDWLKQEAE